MVGQSSLQSDEDQNLRKYHGKRRNATTMISRQFQNSGNNAAATSRINRVNNQNPIYSRLTTTRQQTYNKVDNRWKNGNNLKESHDNRNTTDSNKNYKNTRYSKKNSREVYSTMQAVGRLKISKTYKIGDENDNEVKQLLPSQSFCKLANMEQSVFDLIVKFMQQYFTCFDKNRDELLAAYHAKALFSASFILKSQAISTRNRPARFGSYVKDSRNLQFVQNEDRQYEMLHRNNIDIVACLKKMPSTEHLSNSFKLDSSFFQPNMLTFSISGVYKEKTNDQKFSCFRSFMRTFVCVPVSNDQMLIVNEQCVISNLSEAQTRVYKEEEIEETEMAEDRKQEISTTITSETNSKENMIKKFSHMSNLTLKWARDCLEFSNWDFAAAEKNFVEHKNEIPSDAFIQSLMNHTS